MPLCYLKPYWLFTVFKIKPKLSLFTSPFLGQFIPCLYLFNLISFFYQTTFLVMPLSLISSYFTISCSSLIYHTFSGIQTFQLPLPLPPLALNLSGFILQIYWAIRFDNLIQENFLALSCEGLIIFSIVLKTLCTLPLMLLL